MRLVIPINTEEICSYGHAC